MSNNDWMMSYWRKQESERKTHETIGDSVKARRDQSSNYNTYVYNNNIGRYMAETNRTNDINDAYIIDVKLGK